MGAGHPPYTMPGDFFNLDDDGRRLWTWLQGHAVGRANAWTQERAAASLGWTVRRLQRTLEALNLADFPAASACTGQPMGIFLAVTREELLDYGRSLMSRVRHVARRARKVRRMQPAAAPPAQGQLF